MTLRTINRNHSFNLSASLRAQAEAEAIADSLNPRVAATLIPGTSTYMTHYYGDVRVTRITRRALMIVVSKY